MSDEVVEPEILEESAEPPDTETAYAVQWIEKYEEKIGQEAVFVSELEEFLSELNHKAVGHLHEDNSTEEAAGLLAHFICTTAAYDWLNSLEAEPEVIEEEPIKERLTKIRAEVIDYLQFLLSHNEGDASVVELVEGISEEDLLDEAIGAAHEVLVPPPERKPVNKAEKKDKKKKRKAQKKARKKTRK